MYDTVIVSGNDRMNSHNTYWLEKVMECADELTADLDCGASIAEWLEIAFNSEMEEFLNKNYTTEEHPVWTANDAERFAIAYMRIIDAADYGCRFIPDDCRAEMLSIYTGEEWETTTLRGCSQSDWQTVYYSKEQYSEEAINELEILYFNKGSEWIVHDGTEPPETPDDIDGYSIYVLDDPRKEIAAAEGVAPDKVFLYTSERVMQTVYHESPDNPQTKEKVAVERD